MTQDEIIEIAIKSGLVYEFEGKLRVPFQTSNRLLTVAIAKFAELIQSQAQPTPSQSAPVAWESTTEGYKKYITQKQYDMFNDSFKSWYKPYKCSSCTNLSKPQPTSQDAERLKCLYNHYCAIKQIANTTYEQWLANIDAMKEGK